MDNLSDLMERATRDLTPESPDLVERGIARGIRQRRRRVALLSVTTAAVATVAAVTGGLALTSYDGTQPAPASTSSPSPSTTRATKPKEVTPAETLDTLRSLVPAGLRITEARAGGGKSAGFNQATMIVNDGKGPSLLTAQVQRVLPLKDCVGLTECTVRSDGSVLVARETPLYPYEPKLNKAGLIKTQVEVFRPNGTLIVLESLNATAEDAVQKTRRKPPLTVEQVLDIAESKEWRFPK